jgi:aryl-alcohol dehydrogenase-like predicted oxidoreductase
MAIPYRTLGKTGLSVSVLGFGGSEVGYQAVAQRTVDAILNRALDAGINVIDTAECYEQSEALIGRALGKRRDDVVLMTKCGHASGELRSDWDPKMLAKSIDRSLKRLSTDRVDVMQLHSCGADTLRSGGVIEVLQRARDAGKCRFIGYSGDGDDAIVAVDSGVFDTLQISVNVADQQAIDVVLSKAIARRIGVIAKRPIANAVWKNRSAPSDWYTRPYWDRLRVLDYDFMRGDLIDSVATALGFTLATKGVHTAIVGTTRPENVARNVGMVSNKALGRSEYERIRARWRHAAKRDWVGQR